MKNSPTYKVEDINAKIKDVNPPENCILLINNKLYVFENYDNVTDEMTFNDAILQQIVGDMAGNVFNDNVYTEWVSTPGQGDWVGSNTEPKQGLGYPNEPGFGVGVCSDALAQKMGMTPMEGYEDPTSPNYGNYRFKNFLFVFIPKFYFKITNNWKKMIELSPTPRPGYTIHRAFINAGKEIEGFFYQKYPLEGKVRNNPSTYPENFLSDEVLDNYKYQNFDFDTYDINNVSNEGYSHGFPMYDIWENVLKSKQSELDAGTYPYYYNPLEWSWKKLKAQHKNLTPAGYYHWCAIAFISYECAFNDESKAAWRYTNFTDGKENVRFYHPHGFNVTSTASLKPEDSYVKHFSLTSGSLKVENISGKCQPKLIYHPDILKDYFFNTTDFKFKPMENNYILRIPKGHKNLKYMTHNGEANGVLAFNTRLHHQGSLSISQTLMFYYFYFPLEDRKPSYDNTPFVVALLKADKDVTKMEPKIKSFDDSDGTEIQYKYENFADIKTKNHAYEILESQNSSIKFNIYGKSVWKPGVNVFYENNNMLKSDGNFNEEYLKNCVFLLGGKALKEENYYNNLENDYEIGNNFSNFYGVSESFYNLNFSAYGLLEIINFMPGGNYCECSSEFSEYKNIVGNRESFWCVGNSRYFSRYFSNPNNIKHLQDNEIKTNNSSRFYMKYENERILYNEGKALKNYLSGNFAVTSVPSPD